MNIYNTFVHSHDLKENKVTASNTSVIPSALVAMSSHQKMTPPLELDHCELSHGEIAMHSLVGKVDVSDFPSLRMKFNERPNDQLMRFTINFLGGGLVSQKRFDGMQNIPNYRAFNWLLRDSDLGEARCGISQLEEYSQDIDELKDSPRELENNIRPLALKYAHRIKALKPGEFQLMYGGWANRDGGGAHALVYEFRRSENGTFDIFICNTWSQLGDRYLFGEKTRYQPVVHFINVTDSELLFDSDGVVRPAIIQALMELNVLSSIDNNFTVSEEDVLEIFDRFMHKRINVSQEKYGAITGQRSGSCVPSTTKCWIRKKAGSGDLYKKEIFKVKLRLLIVFYDKFKDMLSQEEGSDARRVLDQIAKKLLRRVAKLRERNAAGINMIPDDLALQATATAFDIMNRVKEAEENLRRVRNASAIPSDPTAFDVTGQRLLRENAVIHVNMDSKHAQLGNSDILDPLPRLEMDGSNILDLLEQVLVTCKSQRPISIRLRLNRVNELVDQLPIPIIGRIKMPITGAYWSDQIKSSYWDQLSFEQLSKCCERLTYIAFNYQKWRLEELKSRELATLLSIHAIVHYIALKLDRSKDGIHPKGRIENYNVHYQGDIRKNYETLVFLDRNEFKRIEEACTYFERFNHYAPKSTLFENENSTEVEKANVKESRANGAFWENFFLNLNPTMQQELESVAEERWPTLTDHEIEECYQREMADSINSGILVHSVSRKVNLPKVQKMIMILEELQWNAYVVSLFMRYNYDYICSLNEMSHLMNEVFLTNTPEIVNVSRKASRRSKYSAASSVEKGGSTKVLDPKMNDHIEPFRVLNAEHKEFYKHWLCLRKIDSKTKKTNEVRALNQAIKDPFLHRLLRVLSQWKLAPSQLIFEVQKNIDKMKCPSLQSLFFHLFFRSPISSGKQNVHLGAGDILVEDDSLVENCKIFITKGLGHFFQLVNKSSDVEEKVNGARFFFEFAFYIGKYLKDAGQIEKAKSICPLEEINRWIILPEVTEKHQGLLHQCRILLHSLTETDKLTAGAISEIYQSWSILNVLHVPGSLKSKALDLLTQIYITDLTCQCKDRIMNDQELRNNIGNNVLKYFAVNNCNEKLNWKSDASFPYPIINVKVSENESYQINLSTGATYISKDKIGGVSSNHFWEWDAIFQRIFKGQRNFDYHASNGQITFNHPVMGSITLITSNGLKIRRQFPESNEWFEFQSQPNGTPDILKFDHLFWAPVNPSNTPFRGYFTALDNHDRKFALDKNGLIIEVCSQSGSPIKDYKIIDGIFVSNETVMLLRFDRHILRYAEKDDAIKKIHYPRYTSLEGNPLIFVEHNGRLVWNDNKEYVLPVSMPEKQLERIPNYLYLKSTNPKYGDKVLVPFQGVLWNDKDETNINIDKRNNEPDYNENEEWGCYRYFSYDVKANKLKGTSTEAELFLAYLSLSQKKYAEAMSIIKKMTGSDKLSQSSMRILEMIRDLPQIEHHPELKTVQLYAYLQWMKEKDKQSVKQIDQYFGTSEEERKRFEKLISDTKDCYQSLNNISAACRLSEDDEKMLLSKLLGEATFKAVNINLYILRIRNDYLEKGSRRQEKLIYRGLRTVPEVSTGRNRSTSGGNATFLELPKCPEKAYYMRSYGVNGTQMYFSDLHKYQNEISTKLQWLTLGSVPKLTTRLLDKDKTHNGQLLCHVLDIAHNGSFSARDELLFKLLMYKIHSTILSSGFVDLLICIISNPRAYPKPINIQNSTINDRKYFVDEISTQYSKDRRQMKSMNVYDGKIPDNQPYRITNYPIPGNSAFDERKQKLEEIQFYRIDFKIDLKEDPRRQQSLSTWCELLEKSKAPDTNGKDDVKFLFDERLLAENEKNFTETLERDLKELREDFEEGKKINLDNPFVNISDVNCMRLLKEIQGEKDTTQQMLDQKMEILLQKINKTPAEPSRKINQLAKVGGGAAPKLSYEDCISCLLSVDAREYYLKNPNLKQKDVEEIARLTLEVVDLKSYHSQLTKIYGLLENIGGILEKDDPTRVHYCQELYGALNEKYQFDGFNVEKQVALRVFAGQTGLIPNKKQVDLIKKMTELHPKNLMKYKDIVIQLIMGGGKTSVIATILMYLAAKTGSRLGLFIVPSSLFDTVKINLSSSINQAFQTQLNAIDMSREDMTEYKLKMTLQQIENAKEHCIPIIIKASTIQSFELETLCQARYVKNIYRELVKVSDQKASIDKEFGDIQVEMRRMRSSDQLTIAAKRDRLKMLESRKGYLVGYEQTLQGGQVTAMNKLRLLCKLVDDLGRSTDALLDEVDLSLDALQQINFPEGNRISLPSMQNDLLLKVFKLLVSNEHKIMTLDGTPTINEFVGLTANNQSQMNTDMYLKHVVPVIAREIGGSFVQIQEQIVDFNEAFIKYVTGQIPIFLFNFIDNPNLRFNEQTLETIEKDWKKYGSFKELQEDMQFIKFLDTLFNGDKEKKEAANLIGLLRHFLVELTPATLTKSGKRDYGLKPDSNGEIIPYLAVHTPARTKFGYHWEEACYYYQYASAFAPNKQQIRSLAAVATRMAQYYIQKNGETFHETVEYGMFLKLFGVPLDKIDEPGMVEDAINYIKGDVNKNLDLQFENVSHKVSFNSERFTSNGVNLLSQLSSRRAMSGTPWNVEGYPKSLAERYEADKGTEGRIFHALIQKEKKGKIQITDLSSVHNFLNTVFEKHPTPKNIRGIIETGGLFKAFQNNYEVAKEVMSFFIKTGYNDEIEGILFFHNDPGQNEPDTLYVWKKGAEQPERVGGSSVESLRARGLTPDKYFVIYDDRHTTGQDIKQIPGAINIVTFDKSMLRRTIGQGIMRLRQFLSSQDVEIVMTKETREFLFNQGSNYESLILSSEKTQSVRKAQHMVLQFQQQIQDIYRYTAIREVLYAINYNLSDARLADVIDTFEPFYVSKMVNEPYLQFGRLKHSVSTKKHLTDTLNRMHQKFLAASANYPDACQQATQKYEEMLNNIAKANCLPTMWQETIDEIGVQQEIEVHQQVQLKQQIQVNTELETEVELELRRYESCSIIDLLEENKIDEKGFLKLLADMKSLEPHFKTLSKQLESFQYGIGKEIIPYQKCFTQPIYGTTAYYHSCKTTLPVFNRRQRPAKQILALKTPHGMRWLLLSERQAKFAKIHLHNLYKAKNPLADQVWLIQPDGSQLLMDHEHAENFPMEEEGVDAGLLEINAFDGNIAYLDSHPAEVEDWMLDHPDLKIRFLKLKVARDKEQNEILRRSPALMRTEQDNAAESKQNAYMFKERLEREQNFQGNFKPETDLKVKLLEPRKVKDLRADLVPLLGVDPTKQDALTQEALVELGKKCTGSSSSQPANIPTCSSSVSPATSTYNPDEEVRELAETLTRRQLNNLRSFHGPFVTKDQVKWLEPSLISILDKPDQICVKDPQSGAITEYLLTGEQVKGLKPHQHKLIPFVNPAHYATFTERWQVQAVPLEHLDKLNLKNGMLQHLSKNQMKKLTKELLSRLISAQAKLLDNLPPEKYGWLSGDLIDLIPQDFRNYIQRDQIEEITDPNIIKSLERLATGVTDIEPGQWTKWIAPSMVPHIDFDTQLHYLTSKEHVMQVPLQVTHLLNPDTQVPHVSKLQAVRLQIPQLPSCPKELIEQLEPHQIPYLTNEQHPYLRGEMQIQAIAEPEKFALLKTKTDTKAGTVNQLQWMHENQYRLISMDQIKDLENEQLLKIPRDVMETIREGLTKEQIQTFRSKELINLLSGRQISAYLSDYQVQFLRGKWQVRSCPNRFVDMLEGAQLDCVSKEQVPYLRGNHQIGCLLSKYISYLTAEQSADDSTMNQIPWMSDHQLQYLIPDQLKGLNANQLYFLKTQHPERWEAIRVQITRPQAETFMTQEHFDLLDADQISTFATLAQVQFMIEPWQINSCPDACVNELTLGQIEQFEALSPLFAKLGKEKLQEIKNIQTIRKIPVDLVPEFSDEQCALFEACDIDYIQKMTAAQISKIKNELLPELSVDQLAHISENHVPHLKGKDQISALGDKESLIQSVTKLQFADLTDKQVTLLSQQQIAQFDALSPLFAMLGKEKLQEVKNIQTIRKIPVDLVPEFSDEQCALFEACDIDYIQKMTAAQISKIKNELLPYLSVDQLAHISENHVSYLKGKVQISALGDKESLIQRVTKMQFADLTDKQVTLLSQQQIAQFERNSDLFNKITTKQLQNIQLIDTIRKIPEGLIKNLVPAQFTLFKGSDKTLIRKLTSHQIKQVSASHKAIIKKIGAPQVPNLSDKLFSMLRLKKSVLLKVAPKFLHRLTTKQIHLRNVQGVKNQFKYRLSGIGKTLMMPLLIAAELICNLAKLIFSTFRALFVPTKVNKEKLKRCVKFTFIVDPAISFLAPVEIFHPAKYLQLKSRLIAFAA